MILVVVAAGVGTYLIRALPLVLGSRVTMPTWLSRWLSFVTPAVLGALLGPSLLLPAGTWIVPWHNPALWAALPTGVIAWFSRNLFLTVVGGLIFFGLAHQVVH